LWYVVPAPRAFDVKPLEYDLTPFAGILNDGREHRVEVSVAGVPEGQSGWSTPANVLVWQDENSRTVTGALTRHEESDPSNTTTHTPGPLHRQDTEGGHRLTVSGYLNTSHGRVVTTVGRTVANTSTHRWTEDENTDGLKARWSDDETVTVDGRGPARVTHTNRAYTVDGEITVDSADRLRTVITLGDHARTSTTRAGKRVSWSRLDDTYTGDAAWTLNVPRDQRRAVGTSGEHYRLIGSEGCYDRTIRTEQGTLTQDRRIC
ncbi:peptide-N4-asparagine amidase, partial [Streptomyces sp. CB01580]